MDFSRDLDNSDFFQYNFWVSFDGPSTYYIISRGRMGVGGSAKYKKITKSEKRIHTFRPYRNFQNNSQRPPISTNFQIRKNLHDLRNILRFCNSYFVTIPDFYPQIRTLWIPSSRPSLRTFERKISFADAPIIWEKKSTVTIQCGIKVLSRNQKSPIATRVFQNQVSVNRKI